GYYKPAAIGDFVWEDSNGNGQQDSGEPGINGVTLTVLGNTGDGAAVRSEECSGGKDFTNLAPASYSRQFVTTAGYVARPANVRNDASDSDEVGGVTGSYTLVSGQTNNTVDAGFYRPVSVGDFVWQDTNGNGQQDAGEPGINGVTLTVSGNTGAGASV